MSLLADLLSKNKRGSSLDGNKTPSPLNVPPTLSKAHGITAQVRKFNNRYVVITVVLVVFIALGAFVASKFGMLSSSEKKKISLPPQPVQQSMPSKAESTGAAPQQANLAPSAATSPVEQSKTARITLEEPPVSVPEKKKSRPPKTITLRHPAQKIERTLQQRPPQPRQKEVAPVKIDTAAKDSFLYAALSAEQKADWKSALASYRKAQAIDPGDYKIMSNVAAVLNNLGLFDEGVLDAERALGKKPDYVPALINAAIGCSSKGHTQKALRYFTYASALDPGNRSLIINLGILHERAGNLDDALATYRQLAEDGDPLALQGMGRIYERRGNRSETLKAYRRIMALPNASPALKKEVKGKLVRMEE